MPKVMGRQFGIKAGPPDSSTPSRFDLPAIASISPPDVSLACSVSEYLPIPNAIDT
jgi:hypothetical protein